MSGRGDLASRRKKTRSVILEAAIVEFAFNGLRGASTQGIADRANISKTKLHYYINGKEELYQEALDHILSIWVQIFEGINLSKGPDAFLADYIERKIRFSLEQPEKVKLFVHEVMRGAEWLKKYWAGSREMTLKAAEQISEWCQEGSIRKVDPILFQFHVWALTEQYATMDKELRFMLDLKDDEVMDVDLIVSEVTQLILRGLKP